MGGVIRVLYLAVVFTLLLWVGLWLYGRFGAPIDPNAVTRAQLASLY